MGSLLANPNQQLTEQVWRAVIGQLTEDGSQTHANCAAHPPRSCTLYEAIADAIGEEEEP